MKVPRVKSCCCGCSLETGTKLSGLGLLILYFIQVLLNIAYLATWIKVEPETGEADDTINEELIIGETVVAALQGVLHAVLLYAAIKKCSSLIRCWLICSAVLIPLWLLYELFLTIVLLNLWEIFLLNIVMSGLELYLFIVVYSFYRELQHATDGQA